MGKTDEPGFVGEGVEGEAVESGDAGKTVIPDDGLKVVEIRDNFVTEASELLKPVLGFQRMFLDNAPEFLNNAPLMVVAGKFNDLAVNLGKEDSLFFNSPELARNFIESLKQFTAYIENEVAKVERRLDFVEFKNLGVDGQWKERVRTALYYAFFMHYGPKRRAEKDEGGNARDYIYHVARVLFNCLIRKEYCFDEVAMIAAALHDTREDWHKGIIALLFAKTHEELRAGMNGKVAFAQGLKEDKNVAQEVCDMQFSFEKFLNPPGIDSDVGRVVDMLTKLGEDFEGGDLSPFLTSVINDKREINPALKTEFIRVLRLLGYFYKFAQYLNKGAADRDVIMDVWRALLVKFADRLDNCRNEKNPGILEESKGCFSPLAKSLGAFNVADALSDFVSDLNKALGKEIVEDRSHWNKLEYTLELSMKEKLLNEFDSKMVPYKRGVDYLVRCKPIGKSYCFENVQEMVRALNNGNDAYLKSLRNCLIFVPKYEDASLSRQAEDTFAEIFKNPLPASPQISNILNKSVLIKNLIETRFIEDQYGNLGRKNLGTSNEYGHGLWRVFGSQREAVETMFGKLHILLFYPDDKDWDKVFGEVLGIFESLSEAAANQVKGFSGSWIAHENKPNVEVEDLLRVLSKSGRDLVFCATGGLRGFSS